MQCFTGIRRILREVSSYDPVVFAFSFVSVLKHVMHHCLQRWLSFHQTFILSARNCARVLVSVKDYQKVVIKLFPKTSKKYQKYQNTGVSMRLCKQCMWKESHHGCHADKKNWIWIVIQQMIWIASQKMHQESFRNGIGHWPENRMLRRTLKEAPTAHGEVVLHDIHLITI